MNEKRPNVYAVSRDIWEHPFFAEEPFSEREAWVWLIGAAAWKDIDTRGNTGQTKLQRGEFSFAVRFLGRRWAWDKARVHRFLRKLIREGMVECRERDGNQIFFICNYNKFQLVGLPKRDGDETPVRRPRDKEETGETGKHRKKEAAQGGLGLDFQFPTWWPTSQFEQFLEHRRKIKKPVTTDLARQGLVNDLTALKEQGFDPAAVVAHATMKGWLTFYKIPGVTPKPPAGGPAAQVDIHLWLCRLELFHQGDPHTCVEKGYWDEKNYGSPPPDRPGCTVPAEARAAYAAKYGPRLAAG